MKSVSTTASSRSHGECTESRLIRSRFTAWATTYFSRWSWRAARTTKSALVRQRKGRGWSDRASAHARSPGSI